MCSYFDIINTSYSITSGETELKFTQKKSRSSLIFEGKLSFVSPLPTGRSEVKFSCRAAALKREGIQFLKQGCFGRADACCHGGLNPLWSFLPYHPAACSTETFDSLNQTCREAATDTRRQEGLLQCMS